ncbi:MAG: Type II secretion system F domain protein [Candidatus Woesebacteria bacterium GW2011_GWA1_39_21]|uniref:Type II secretion system F domain protein n=1 Tax=Candidatus Woesebacteria bacterium GW2011_GWA1_39_21 TaxID=1618550 RepID=A0A0G0REA2_9BACT|nr:MAG: Type II secretion system F domain protein [Candidatus Woesebacteria bacterium GW2011_GWA1_39_21]
MKRFKYRARTTTGEVVKGEVEATSDKIAAKLLKRKGYIIVSIKPKAEFIIDITRKFRDRVTSKDVANFTRQLATMMNAGLPITESLLILRNQSTGRLQVILTEILNDVEGGHSLSSSLEKYPSVFNKTYVALIKSGEIGGVLDAVLAKLSDSLEKQQEFSGRVKGAMVYPSIIVIGMLIVTFIMLVFVIPRLTSLYDQFDAELPITTKLLLAVSDAVSKYWYLVIGAGVAIYYMFKLYIKTKTGRKKFDEFKFKIPLIGSLQRQVILTDLTRTISLMVGSRVSILESLYITSEVADNSIISEALIDAGKMVEKGFPVAFSFAKHPEAFPPILSQMISVGEETGKMDEVLDKISHVFESESDQKLKAITAAIEPIILIFLGVGVAFLVISVIMPIYNLTSQI